MLNEKSKNKAYFCDPRESRHTRPLGLPEDQVKEHRRHDLVAFLKHKQYFVPEAKQIAQKVETKTRREFEDLVKAWRRDTAHLAYTAHRTAHKNYLRLAVLGEKILPLILAELEERPSRSWLPLLEAIAGENIAHDASSIDEAIDKWLEWGHHRQLV